jgi:hypothetical protein
MMEFLVTLYPLSVRIHTISLADSPFSHSSINRLILSAVVHAAGGVIDAPFLCRECNSICRGLQKEFDGNKFLVLELLQREQKRREE